MRVIPTLTALPAILLLVACQPPVPNSGPNFDIPAQRRDAQLSGQAPLQVPPTILPPATPPGGTIAGAPLTEAQILANETRAALGQPLAPLPNNPVELPGQTASIAPLPAPLPNAPAPLPSATGTPTAPDLDRDNPNISREQDFAAVSAQRDIEADAERLRAARQQYQLVTPTELQRPDETGPNIFAYALGPARAVGSNGAFRRGLGASARRAANKCQNYRSADIAQEDFLASGGPERDRLGIDPDGDGNACGWDPAVVRNLVRQQ